MEASEDRYKNTIMLTVNSRPVTLEIGDSPGQIGPNHTLAQTLRDNLGLTGTKIGCDQGACGSCTVIMDGRPVLSCMTLTIECQGKEVRTIEGLSDPVSGELDPLQKSFVDHTAFQCGFCTPGIIMASKSLLEKKPDASSTDIKESLAGHFCRCISHYQVLDAVSEAVDKKRKVS